MNWLDLILAYGHAVDAVLAAADVWAPLLLAVASLGWRVRQVPSRRYRRDNRPDTSGQGPDTPADIAAPVSR